MNKKDWQKFAALSNEMSRLRRAMEQNDTGVFDAISPLNILNNFDQTSRIVKEKRKLSKNIKKG